jgi:hypothetical protein
VTKIILILNFLGKMKNLDLNGLGVQEMNAEEMDTTNGGFVAFIIFGVGFGLIQLAAAIWPMDEAGV